MELKGINHLALVCRDMEETVRFYRDLLGMPLVKTVALPGGGQHFFFDCGGGNCVAFFWFPHAKAAVPGIASPKIPLDMASHDTAIASMNHVAFTVAEERLPEYRDRLIAAGVDTFAHIVNHDDSEKGYSRAMHEGVFLRSVYFMDPNGIMLEFAAQTKSFDASDVRHAPMKAARVLEKV